MVKEAEGKQPSRDEHTVPHEEEAVEDVQAEGETVQLCQWASGSLPPTPAATTEAATTPAVGEAVVSEEERSQEGEQWQAQMAGC